MIISSTGVQSSVAVPISDISIVAIPFSSNVIVRSLQTNVGAVVSSSKESI